MAVPNYPGAEAPTAQRPTIVSLAGWLVYAAAGISLLGSLLTAITMGRTLDAY